MFYCEGMTWNSGPNVSQDMQGRATAHGYLITGNDGVGFRARADVPLTASEVTYGVQDLLFADNLADICALARAELIKRSQVSLAAELTARTLAPDA